MKEIKSEAMRARDLLSEATAPLEEVQSYLAEKLDAAYERGRDDHADKWSERGDEIDEILDTTQDLVDRLGQLFA